MNVNEAVLERYTEGAQARVEELCCPVDYDTNLLKILPQEIIDRDYGCGDPSRYVEQGDVVLDLGSGSGKICYMAAQLVGENGHIIGIDMNDEMLALARRYQDEMAEKLGGDRVDFRKGHIQDLALDVDAMQSRLTRHPVEDTNGLEELETWKLEQRLSAPLVTDGSVDLVISNCVLNLVNDNQKQQMVREIYRVLKPGGRIAISDIISDEPIPPSLKEDKTLWSGCISGAFQEQEMLAEFQQAGFRAICYDKWADEPWQVIKDIEFRSVTLTAIKPEEKESRDSGHTVIYKGPYALIRNDDGLEFPRGERIAVSENTFRLLMQAPCRDDFIAIEPADRQNPKAWETAEGSRRPNSATRGAKHNNRNSGSSCC